MSNWVVNTSMFGLIFYFPVRSISSRFQLVDIFTQALGGERFHKLLGNSSIHASTWRGVMSFMEFALRLSAVHSRLGANSRTLCAKARLSAQCKLLLCAAPSPACFKLALVVFLKSFCKQVRFHRFSIPLVTQPKYIQIACIIIVFFKRIRSIKQNLLFYSARSLIPIVGAAVNMDATSLEA